MLWVYALCACAIQSAALIEAGDFAKNIAAIVGNLTLQEKYSLLQGVSSSGADGYYVGTILNISRLGIPSIKMQDAGQGFRTSDARLVGQVTSWPCALALAATWDSSMAYEFASAAADEFVIKGANMVLGPGLNVHRVALGGRNAEYLSGEDPVLGAALVGEWVRGFQEKGILATAKHYLLNNQETNRVSYSAQASPRAVAEVYMVPFRAAALAGSAAAMCSYNKINGTYSCSNAATLRELKTLLRGWVMSDWGATHATAVEQGLDQDMPGTDDWYSPNQLNSVHGDAIDAAVTNVLGPLLSIAPTVGCQPGPDCAHDLFETNATSTEHDALAERILTQGTLLLKNDALLPLDRSLKVGLVGSVSDAPNNVTDLISTMRGNYYVVGGSGRVVPARVVTILEGLVHAGFDNLQISPTDDVSAALSLDVDVLIACGGATSGEGADRTTLSLDQEDFLVRISNQSTLPVVIVALAPGAILLPFKDDAAAIIVSFFGGQATGAAIANIISGAASPSAKSPVTFPLSVNDTILPCRDLSCPYAEDLYVGYKALHAKPVAFPFGHGLSFATFGYNWASTPDASILASSPSLSFDVVLTNVHAVYSGVETPQVYITYPPEANEPSIQLKAFSKTPLLPPNRTALLHFELDMSSFRIYSPSASSWIVVAGLYDLYVGASSRDLRLHHSFYIEPRGAVPKVS